VRCTGLATVTAGGGGAALAGGWDCPQPPSTGPTKARAAANRKWGIRFMDLCCQQIVDVAMRQDR
jgi:hypothetical protein